jgi:hypothetical protein
MKPTTNKKATESGSGRLSVSNNWNPDTLLKQFDFRHFVEGYDMGFGDGHKEGHQQAFDQAKEEFNKNIMKATVMSSEVYNLINSLGVKTCKAYFRITSLHTFESLFMIDLDSYLNSDLRHTIYEIFLEKCEKQSSSKFHMDFTLTDYSKNVNVDLLKCDGFVPRTKAA